MRHIPNILTLGNLFCGCLGIAAIFNAKPEAAFVLTLCSLLLDFLDGFSARLLKAYSETGKQLDSLADMVSFGAVPGFTLYTLFFMGTSSSDIEPGLLAAGQHFMFLVTLFSALRLAKFNVDTRQKNHFIGLPTPANTLMIMPMPLILSHDTLGLGALISHPVFLLAFTCISSGLLVAEIPLIALKFKTWKWSGNQPQYALLIFSAISIGILGLAAPMAIIVFYLILSLLFPPEKSFEL